MAVISRVAHQTDRAMIVGVRAVVNIDIEAIEAITSLQQPGSPDLFGKIVSMFELNTPGLIESIETGFAAGDAEAIRAAAHSLKSSAAYVGASELSALCKTLETAAREDTLSQVSAEINRLGECYIETLAALHPYRQKAA